MSKGRVENYSYLSVKQLALKGRFSPAYLEKNKEVSVSISCLYGGYNIRLSHTPCHYGGVRFWLLCPVHGCSKRCSKRLTQASSLLIPKPALILSPKIRMFFACALFSVIRDNRHSNKPPKSDRFKNLIIFGFILFKNYLVVTW